MTRNPIIPITTADLVVEEFDWLSSDEVIVVWSLIPGMPIATSCIVECHSGHWEADGDCPRAVELLVAQAASLRYATTDDRDDFDEDAAERRSGGYRHAPESYFEGDRR